MTTNDAPTLERLLRHQSLVRLIARDLLIDPDAADDVVQQTWLAALRHSARGAAVGRSLLARIATNLAFNRRRDTRRREVREQRAAVAEPLASVAELVEREDERRRVVDAVFALHEPMRETVLRRYFDDRTEEDVAAVLGVPIGTVRTRLRRARALLRERLGGEGDAPRSARALVALAGWSADEAAAAIVFGKGVVLMGAKAWVGVAAAIAVVTLVGAFACKSTRDGERSLDPTTVEAKSDESATHDSAQDSSAATAASPNADRSVVAAEPTPPPSVPAPRITTIRGRCVAPDRTPIVGATVTSREYLETTTTDASGGFALAVATRTTARVELRDSDSVSLVATMPGRVRTSKFARMGTRESIQLGEFVMPIGASIHGRVLDESDRPVEATVELRPGTSTDVGWEFGLTSGTTFVAMSEGSVKSDALVRADSKGAFAFEGIPVKWYSLVALHPEYISAAPVAVAVTAGVTSDVVVRVRRVRDDERIRGRVVDADGKPVLDASVTWDLSINRDSTGLFSSGREIKLDPTGVFTVFGCAGSEHEFTATLRSGAAAKATGIHGGDPEVVLRLERSPSATITVVDAADGSPCESAAVSAYATDRSSGRYASTDSAGRASIELPVHDFMLQVARRGCDRVELGPFPGGVDPALAPIRVQRLPSLHGVVTGCDGSRAAGARVEMFIVPSRLVIVQRGGFPALNARSVSSAVVKPDGAFELPLGKLAAETSRAFVRIELPGFAPAQTELPLTNPLDADPITLNVTAGGSMAGHVTAPAPRSPAGLVVLAGNDDGDLTSARVEEDGSYRLDHLRPGMWRVAVSIDDPPEMHWTVERSFPVPDIVIAEGRVTALDLKFLPAGLVTLSGVVRLAGTALVGTSISVRSEEAHPPIGSGFVYDQFEVARTDAAPSGSFAVDVETPGRYTLRATIALGADEVQLERVIDLVAGANAVLLDPRCGAVTGTCGHPSNGSTVAHGKLADGTNVRVRAMVAADGTFTMPHVPAGSFKLSAAADSKDIEVRAGETTTVELK